MWHQSGDGILRKYYQTNEMTSFHAGNTNGEGFIFRNTAHDDIFTIKDNGDIYANTSFILPITGQYILGTGTANLWTIYVTAPNGISIH